MKKVMVLVLILSCLSAMAKSISTSYIDVETSPNFRTITVVESGADSEHTRESCEEELKLLVNKIKQTKIPMLFDDHTCKYSMKDGRFVYKGTIILL